MDQREDLYRVEKERQLREKQEREKQVDPERKPLVMPEVTK